MDFTGRPLTGYVYVAEAGQRGAGLARWANEAADFVETVPAKPRRKATRTRPRAPKSRAPNPRTPKPRTR
jgi:hypothetical protein